MMSSINKCRRLTIRHKQVEISVMLTTDNLIYIGIYIRILLECLLAMSHVCYLYRLYIYIAGISGNYICYMYVGYV